MTDRNTPSPDDRELMERLKLHAKRSSEVSKMMAQSKSLRQAHDPPRDDLYMWAEPEQTIEWKAADRIESLLADRAKLEERVRELETARGLKIEPADPVVFEGVEIFINRSADRG